MPRNIYADSHLFKPTHNTLTVRVLSCAAPALLEEILPAERIPREVLPGEHTKAYARQR